MIFDAIPFELKEHIFSYVTPNEWINTGKVSQEWLELTLGSIKKVESCHLLILDHLAEFINEHHNTNYTWLSLLPLMPKLEQLMFREYTEGFWERNSPIKYQLKDLDCNPIVIKSSDWNKPDITFGNLVELLWDGDQKGPGFLLEVLQLAPKLEKITLKRLKVNAEWKNMIPKSVKHILLKDVQFLDEHQCSIHNLCEDSSTLETFSVSCERSHAINSLNSYVISNFLDSIHLKKLALSHPTASDIVETAFTKFPNLETVCIYGGSTLHIRENWRIGIPACVKSFQVYGMSIEENVRHNFSFNWLFQNYGTLQSLHVRCVDWTGVDPQKFHSPKNLKKLYLDNYRRTPYDDDDEPIDPFSDICYYMIGGSHLVDVELHTPVIDESWRHIFPPTIKTLKLVSFRLSNEAKRVFSPQFICENPSYIEFLALTFDGYLPAMDSNAFNGMRKLEELHLIYSSASGECLQSILTHCSALKNLFLRELTSRTLTNIPHNLVLLSLRKLHVRRPVDQLSLLLQHFPKMRKVDITILPLEESCLEAMSCLQGVETAEINVIKPPFGLLWSLIEYIDDTEFKYFCLAIKDARNGEFTFYLTNSLLDACTDFHRFNLAHCVLWMKKYPTSRLLRERRSRIPWTRDELLQVYRQMALLRLCNSR